MALLVILLVVIGLGVAIAGSQVSGGRQKFVALGDVRGKTLEEIVRAVGPPSSISAAAEGCVLYQWMKTSSAGAYHYALLFKDGVCLGYTHQHVS